MAMAFRALVMAIFVAFESFQYTHGHDRGILGGRDGAGGRRVLLSFRETPGGGNATFECSPSGPCVPCLYSEKNDEKYRCSETGYRIPLKCVEIEDGSKEANSKRSQKSRSTLEIPHSHSKAQAMVQDSELTTSIRPRRLLDDSSTLKGGPQAYITYRSCITSVNEEKLSVLGFEPALESALYVYLTVEM
ncbi:hypothetical protein HHK36_007125 [Tetracentron sinense]|uniref:Uncharacterized protein n=1 Tax=Tetracentron sinense TaxID=13715 RepID=A0A834ZLY3_TETSI|nr:hypothetical protein HHK36_007125 [Tetracentron sinense]